jgi:Xaa-Pro aminopeptidase
VTGGNDYTSAPAVLESALADTLEAREAAAFVHAGSARDPTIRYCRPSLDTGRHALAFDGREWRVRSAAAASGHPAAALASRLVDEELSGVVLTPARIPHDAALYFEEAGFSLASSDVVEQVRAAKTDEERDRIATAQAAAGAGVRRAAALLADATSDGDGLAIDDDPLTADRLRTAADETIVSTGALPAGNTVVSPVSDDVLRAGSAITVEVAPREPGGYHGGLARTFVVDGEGGPERRAHVGVTQAFRSASAMLTADVQSVTAVEADLEAEVRAFGFGDDDGIETTVTGVGLEHNERPYSGNHEIGSGAVVRLEASVGADDGRVRIADLLAIGSDGVEWIEPPSRSLEPAVALE